MQMNGIQARRKKRNLTQSQLAEKLGTTQGAVSQWEKGIAFPSADKLPELAKILGCSIDALYNSVSA